MPSSSKFGLERRGHDLEPRKTLVSKLGLVLSGKPLRTISHLNPFASGLIYIIIYKFNNIQTETSFTFHNNDDELVIFEKPS